MTIMNMPSDTPSVSTTETTHPKQQNLVVASIAFDAVPPPYPHQVGGHGYIARSRKCGRVLKPLDKTFVEKPLNEKELRFYKRINHKNFPVNLRWLREFTATFYGRKELHIERLDKGNDSPLKGKVVITNIKGFSDQDDDDEDDNTPGFLTGKAAWRWEGTARSAKGEKLRWYITGSGDSDDDTDDDVREVDKTEEDNNQTSEEEMNELGEGDVERAEDSKVSDSALGRELKSGSEESPHSSGDVTGRRRSHGRMRWKSDTNGTRKSPSESIDVSPWAIKMTEKRSKATEANVQVVPRFYVELQDLTQGYHFPCVMDCKIGVRHYDDDASPEKRRRHILKAKNTTTGSMGMRITGMQVYRGEGNYIFRDKYHGRSLKDKDLMPELMWFFSNGEEVRVDVLDVILAKLKVLAEHMEAQRSFKFYSSSLLLTYEGDTALPPCPQLKMIDFAHTQSSKGETDEGYNFGIRNLISLLEQGRSKEPASQ